MNEFSVPLGAARGVQLLFRCIEKHLHQSFALLVVQTEGPCAQRFIRLMKS